MCFYHFLVNKDDHMTPVSVLFSVCITMHYAIPFKKTRNLVNWFSEKNIKIVATRCHF